MSGASGEGRAPRLELDHLVVGASSLDDGRRWCERTFGVAPQPGGRHLTMATHNVLLSIASPAFPKAYLEIIAIDPEGAAIDHARWFDLDDADVRRQIAVAPTLLHWVARSEDIDTTLALFRAAGHDPGDIVASERATAAGGLLRWRITLPLDGRRSAGGAVPLLIDWGAEHPTDSLPASGVEVESVQFGGDAASPPGWAGTLQSGRDVAPFTVVLRAPLGPVTLAIPRLAR